MVLGRLLTIESSRLIFNQCLRYPEDGAEGTSLQNVQQRVYVHVQDKNMDAESYSARRVQEGSISQIFSAVDRWKALLESAVTAAVGSLFHIWMALGNRLYPQTSTLVQGCWYCIEGSVSDVLGHFDVHYALMDPEEHVCLME